MSLGRDTIRGALWTVCAGAASRAVGLLGTLLITRFVAPAEYGEVIVAAVLTMTANQLSTIGWGQYLVARPDAPRSATFHVTTFHVGLGVLMLGLLLAAGDLLGPMVDAPRMARYLPGLALSVLMDRIAFVPERILVRTLRFRRLSMGRMTSDVTHSVIGITFAALGFGGAALVIANVARSCIRVIIFVASVEVRDWLEPCRLNLRQTRELLAFGIPMSLGALCEFATRRWDNLLVSRYFGPATTGMYNLAYNLADIPAIQIGEQIGDVLLPSFARMEPARRPEALIRSLSLLSLVVFPLAIGLGAVAPTLVATIFDERWRPLGPMLVLLSALSLARPLGWTVASYLQARHLPRRIFALEAFKLVILGGSIMTFGRNGPLWTCAAVGFAFGAHAILSLWTVRQVDSIPLHRSLSAIAPALFASLLMGLAVLTVRNLLDSFVSVRPFLALGVEVLVGALSYALAASVLARRTSRELVAKLYEALAH